MKISVILLAAGRSRRFSSKISKPLVLINNKPVISYSLNLFGAHPLIKEVIVVVNRENESEIIRSVKKFGIKKVKCFVKGGLLRQDSVKNGLREVSPDADLILIHDAARPFAGRAELDRLIKKVSDSGAAILGVPVKGTVKSVKVSECQSVKEVFVEKTLDRSRLWEAQTPQGFAKDLILKAYKKFGSTAVTDDAALIEKLGVKVSMVLGSYNNIKITTPEDLIFAKALAKYQLINKKGCHYEGEARSNLKLL